MIIAYNDNNKLRILMPAMLDVDINILAEKDVPAGIMYRLIPSDNLPTEPFETWQVDINNINKDGVGLTADEFHTKYPQYSNWAVK